MTANKSDFHWQHKGVLRKVLHFYFFSIILNKMDPYEFTQTIHEDVQDDSQDDLKKLEKDLAPSSADYYGVLNISRKVNTL